MTTQPIVSFSHVDIFHGDHLVLKDVCFSVQPGEFVYLIGKVGSGKTSLIKILNAELPLHKGKVDVAGFPIHLLKKNFCPKMYF